MLIINLSCPYNDIRNSVTDKACEIQYRSGADKIKIIDSI